MKDYVSTLTKVTPKVLDTAPFTAFSKAAPSFDDAGFLLPVDAGLQSLMTNYELEIGSFDADANTITYYGRDHVLSLNGEGSLCSDFDGTWICLNGEPLYVEPVSSTASAVEYKAHVCYDGDEAYLMLAYDRDSEEYTISAVRKVDSSNEVNDLASSRSKLEPEAGKSIVPIYQVTNFKTGETRSVNGRRVIFNAHTSITREMLPAGYYLMTAVIMDQRGDSYYSQVIGATVSGRSITAWKADDRFFGRDY